MGGYLLSSWPDGHEHGALADDEWAVLEARFEKHLCRHGAGPPSQPGRRVDDPRRQPREITEPDLHASLRGPLPTPLN
jgi:hypothetical protein